MKALIASIVMLAFLSACSSAENCPDTNGPEPFPILVVLTGKDPNGVPLYTRYAYVYLGPINQPGFQRGLVADDVVSIVRWLRSDDEGRCNVAYPPIVETGYFGVNYCADPTPGSPIVAPAPKPH